jgi:uncharacterized membrane protein
MNKKQHRGKKTKQQTDIEQKQLELTDLVGQNLEAVVAYQLRTEQELDHHQHLIEAITKNVGRPRFLYLVLLLVVLWIGAQGLQASFGRASFDPAPMSSSAFLSCCSLCSMCMLPCSSACIAKSLYVLAEKCLRNRHSHQIR